MVPYRENPKPADAPSRGRGDSYRAARARLLATTVAIVAAGAFLPVVGRNCRTRNAPGVPPELLTAGASFPSVPATLQPAVPLEPLLVADAPERLAVLSPKTTAQNLRPGAPLVIRFNRPMVEGAAVGKPADPSLLVFGGATKGRLSWTSRSTLSFEPERSTWDRTHGISVSLSPELRSLAGEEITEVLEHTVVFDNGPQLVGRAGEARLVPGEPVHLWFSGKVDPTALTPGLMVYEVGGGRRMLPFTVGTSVHKEGRTRVDLALRAALEPGAHLAVAIAPPFSYGGDSPRVVELELAPKPHIEGIDCPKGTTEASGCAHTESPGRIIDIAEAFRVLSSEKLEELKPGSVVVTPPLDEMRTRIEDEKAIVLEGAFAPAQVYQVSFEGLRDDQGHALTRTPPFAIRSAGRNPEIRAQEGRLTYERGAPFTLPIAGIHLDQAEARVFAVPVGDELTAFAHPASLVANDAKGFATIPLSPIVPEARPNRWGTAELDWTKLSPSRSSMVVASLIADDAAKNAAQLPTTFLQQTDLGIDAVVFPRGVLTWVTSIATAKPVAGAKVTIADADANPIGLVTTDESGMVWLPVSDTPRIEHEVLVRATYGDDRALMVVDPRSAMTPRHFGVSPGAQVTAEQTMVASVFTDRGIVRPGETFHGKALIRTKPEAKEDGALVALRDENVQLSVFGGPNEAPLFERTAKLSAFGTVDASFTLDDDARPGSYRLEARVGDQTTPVGMAAFTVGDYRPPTFRVDLTAPDVDLVEKDTLRVDVAATYMFGPPAAGRTARFTITRTPAGAPDDWDAYTFSPVDAAVSTATMAAGELRLDAEGHAVVNAPVAIGTSLRAQATVEVTVNDVSGQSTSAHHTLPLYPAAFEVGVREVPRWIEPDGTLDLDAVVVDHDGKAVPARTIEARIVREGWHRYWEWSGDGGGDDGSDDGSDDAGDDDAADDAGTFQARRAHRVEVVHRCKLTSAAEAVHCIHKPKRPGTYVLEATTKDDVGRVTTASQRVYVAGPDEHPDRDRPGASIALTPKEDSLTVGATAEVAFESPFPDAEARLVVHAGGVLHSERRRVVAGGNVFRFPVTADMVPNAFVSLSLVRPRTGPPSEKIDLEAPDLRVGLTELTVRPAASPLTVSIEAPERWGAGGDVEIGVNVVDAAGAGVEAELALYAVDEGTLRVTSYETPAADAGFFPRMAPSFAWEDLRRSLVSRITEPLLPGAGGDGGEAALRLTPEQLERFEPTPLWLPHVTTDASGRAQTVLHLPERSTQYRIMAVASDAGIRSGNAERTLVASMPVVVRPVLPAVATVGDRFEAVAFIHNTGDAPVDVVVTPTVYGEARTERTVHIDTKSDVRVSEWVDVTRAGELAIGFATQGDDGTTDARSRVEVAPRARVVRSSAVGAVQGSRTLSLTISEDDVDPLTIAVASHPFVGFDTALDAMLEAPDAGTERAAASLIALAAYATLDPGLRAANEGPEIVSDEEITLRAAGLVKRLGALQAPNGGFGTYTVDDAPDAYLTAFALHALSAASRAGFAVREERRIKARDFLAERVRGNDFLDHATGEGPGSSGHDELAFALRVLSEEASPDLERIEAVFAQRERLTPYGLSQLILSMPDDDFRRVTLAADALRVLHMRVDEAQKPSVLRWYDSSARTLGAVLEAASSVEAVHEATPELASRLLLARRPDTAAWGSSHETSYALAGLAAYAGIFPKEELDDTVLAIDGQAVEPARRDDELALYTVPAGRLAPGAHEVRIATRNTAWFAIDGSTVVPLGKDDEVARGAVAALHRRLEDAAGKPLASGAHVQLGDLVRVRLFLFTENDAPPHVVVRDHLAGGLEPIDSTLATSPRESLSALLGMGPDDDVVDARAHYALRSIDLITHRVVAPGEAAFYFANAGSGLHEVTYGVRATTVGTFVLPPAEATAIYAHDFVARSAMSSVVVEP